MAINTYLIKVRNLCCAEGVFLSLTLNEFVTQNILV